MWKVHRSIGKISSLSADAELVKEGRPKPCLQAEGV